MTPNETIVRILVGLFRGTRALVVEMQGSRVTVQMAGQRATYSTHELEVVE